MHGIGNVPFAIDSIHSSEYNKRIVDTIEPLLTARQVAERWGVCIATVKRNKRLKQVRFNSRLIRYRLSDVEALEKPDPEPTLSTAVDSHTLSTNVPDISGQMLTPPPAPMPELE